MTRRISWLTLWDPADGTNRMCTWIGDTVQIVVTGLPPGFAASASMTFELPDGAAVHGVPPDPPGFAGFAVREHETGRDLARRLRGVLFTVHRKDAIELLLEVMATPRTFVTVSGKSAPPAEPSAWSRSMQAHFGRRNTEALARVHTTQRFERQAALHRGVQERLEAEVGCAPGEDALGLLVDRELARAGKLPLEALAEMSAEHRALVLEGKTEAEASANVAAFEAELLARFGPEPVPPEVWAERARLLGAADGVEERVFSSLECLVPRDVKLRDTLIPCPCGCGLLITGTRKCDGCDREISLAHWDNLYDSCGECADRTGRAGDDR